MASDRESRRHQGRVNATRTNYLFSIELANGVDKPQMDVMERRLAA